MALTIALAMALAMTMVLLAVDLAQGLGSAQTIFHRHQLGTWELSSQSYIQDVPLECPKVEMVEKWSGNGFGPSQMTCPKSGQKVSKK